jgi:hypothetical protein
MVLEGWVKLHRQTLHSAVVTSLPPADFKVFVACLLSANNRTRQWFNGHEDEAIPRGSFVTSQPHLAADLRLTRKQIRGALERLEKIGSIWAKPRAKRYTLITIVNFEAYQAPEGAPGQAMGQRRAKSGPTPGHNVRRKKEEEQDPSVGSPRTAGQNGHATNGHPAAAPPAWVAELPRPFRDIPPAWWATTLGLFPAIDHEAVCRGAAAYWLEQPEKYRDPCRFLRNQLDRAYGRRATRTDSYDGYGPDFPVTVQCGACGELHHGTLGTRPACPATGQLVEPTVRPHLVAAPEGAATC